MNEKGKEIMLVSTRSESAQTAREMLALVRDLFQDAGALVQDQAALLRAEVRRDVARLSRAAVGFGIASALLHVALIAWCAAAVLALAESVGPVSAAVILGGVFAAAGGVALLASRRLVRRGAPGGDRRPGA